jgi:uncharacterized membrane protein YccC
MTTATIGRPLSLAGVPVGSWAFGIRVWVAVVVALGASFWLELEVPSTAAITVAILAAPTRGQALDKACFRLIATIIGVAAAIVIVGLFFPGERSDPRRLRRMVGTMRLRSRFAGWEPGICRGALWLHCGVVAIEQLDAPQNVFETGMARGAAIAVGIVAIAAVNDLLAAPDSHPQMAVHLAAIHRRLRNYAKTAIREEATDPATAAELLRDITALHSETASLATESATGSMRSAAARSTAVALVAELHAARAVNALRGNADPALCELMASALDRAPPLPAVGLGVRRASSRRDGLAVLLVTR